MNTRSIRAQAAEAGWTHGVLAGRGPPRATKSSSSEGDGCWWTLMGPYLFLARRALIMSNIRKVVNTSSSIDDMELPRNRHPSIPSECRQSWLANAVIVGSIPILKRRIPPPMKHPLPPILRIHPRLSHCSDPSCLQTTTFPPDQRPIGQYSQAEQTGGGPRNASRSSSADFSRLTLASIQHYAPDAHHWPWSLVYSVSAVLWLWKTICYAVPTPKHVFQYLLHIWRRISRRHQEID